MDNKNPNRLTIVLDKELHNYIKAHASSKGESLSLWCKKAMVRQLDLEMNEEEFEKVKEIGSCI